MTTSVKSTTNKIFSSQAFKVVLRLGFFVVPLLLIINIVSGFYYSYHIQKEMMSDEIGQLADYSYDTARDISHVVTILSAVLGSIAGLKIAGRDGSIRSIAIGFGLSLGIPLAVHLIGTFSINNF